MIKYIELMKELNGKKPCHRDPIPNSTTSISGIEVRQQIVLPLLKAHDQLVINLTGYNRYSRGFLNEMVEGLIVDENMSPELVKKKLHIIHDDVASIVEQCNQYIDKHIEKKEGK